MVIPVEGRGKAQAPIAAALGPCGSADALHLWERSAVRLWVGKPALPEFVNLACAKGKYSGTCRLGGVPPPVSLNANRGRPPTPLGGAPSGPRAPGPDPTPRPGLVPPRGRALPVSLDANRSIALSTPGAPGPGPANPEPPGPR